MMKSLLAFVFTIFAIQLVQAQIITTIAGTGGFGFSGDGGMAINAQLGDMYYCYPAFDNNGNMYISQGNNNIRKIDASGIITTIAGKNGILGYTGDGGLAIDALVYHPTGMAVDNANNLFFDDANGNYIRKINTLGIITTVSGQDTNTCGLGDAGLFSQARFWAISAITFDKMGNLYIADYGCNKIRKVSINGIVTTIAGNGTLGYSGDGGPATAAQLRYPCKVAVDNAGNVYIPDAQNHRVRKVDLNGIITTVAGTGASGYSGDGGLATQAALFLPGSVVIDNLGNMYIGDHNNLIRKIDTSGIITTFAGTGVSGYTGDGGLAVNAKVFLTEGRISIDNNNNIYFADEINSRIRKITTCLSASLSIQPANVVVCSFGNAVFSTNAINATGYLWQEYNGTSWNDLVDNNNYSGTATNTLKITNANTPLNGYQYRCRTINACGSIYSIPATLTVTAPFAPILTITTTTDTVCAGTNVAFNASPINGGSNPIYQWKKNGNNVGTNSISYADNTLVSGDIITCVLTFNSNCTTSYNANSNIVSMTVISKSTPGITILPSINNFCYGTDVTFTAKTINEGTNPLFQWSKNGINVGNNTPNYSDNSLGNGDKITCSVQSNGVCLVAPTANSNVIVMNVTPLATPSVSISTNNQSVCNGQGATFMALATNGGTLPSYQWKTNNINVGGNSNTFTSNTFQNGDVVNCTMIVNGNCLAINTVFSNPIVLQVLQNPMVVLDKNINLCTGSSRTLDAGTHRSYLWNDGSIGRTLSINLLGLYSVTVTDNNSCKGSDTVHITNILPIPTKFLPSDTAICSYGQLIINAKTGYTDYLWNNNAVTPFLTINQSGLYWLEVRDNNGCTGKDTIIVSSKQCMQGFYIPTAFTPNGDALNDYFKPLLFGNIKKFSFMVYNRLGQLIFQSTDITKGWDGKCNGSKEDANVFIWICSYQLENEPEEIKKGTVVLLK